MTNTPGDDEQRHDPTSQPSGQQPDPPPGYWEQQSQGSQQSYPTQGYGQPQGYAQQGYPVQYAPDHPKATTSLVLGILALVLCQILGPFAWKIGKSTVDEIDASQGQLGGRGAAQAGYVLGIIATALLALFLLIITLAIVGGIVASTTTG